MGQAKPKTPRMVGSSTSFRASCPPPRWKKVIKHFFETLVFLFVLAVFLFSLYKILTISGVFKPLVYGRSCGFCDFDLCDWECGWQPRPTITPTPTPVATLTPPEPEATPALNPTSTPIPPSQGNDGDGGGGSGEPPICGAEVPGAPVLLTANRISSHQVDLSWTEVAAATHYSLVYGLSAASYFYGVSDAGEVTSFTVGDLEPAVDYCFAVRAVNDCAPSDLSNEICLGVPAGQVLGVSTLGDTGDRDDEIFQLLFIIGSLCLAFGMKGFNLQREARREG